MVIGEVIKSLRQSRKIKQYQLAERVGVTPAYLSQVESDKKFPGHTLVADIARELGTSTGYLYFRALDKHDFPPHKHATFAVLHPILNQIMERLM